MIHFIIKLFIWINNFSYSAISSLSVRDNDGIHPKHRIMKYHDFFLNNTTRSDHVLDIGCGNGTLAYDLSQKATHVTAIDISPKNIALAQKRFPLINLTYLVGDATTYQFQKQFDTIILSNVLEHIDQRINFLNEISHLAPKILIRVPLITREWLAVYKKEIGMEYRLDPTHFIEYTEEIFSEELIQAGLFSEQQYVKFGELYVIARPKK